jgi:iron complex outermembrane receptor protein
MDEVIVIGDKQVSPEITRQEIPVKVAEKPVISTIPDILDVTAGLDIQRRSILTPKQSQVRIRGMDERRAGVDPPGVSKKLLAP